MTSRINVHRAFAALALALAAGGTLHGCGGTDEIKMAPPMSKGVGPEMGGAAQKDQYVDAMKTRGPGGGGPGGGPGTPSR
jgi:hypothetical protein